MRHGALLAIAALAATASGCAYFNTFYSARKNFNEAEKLYVTPDQRATAQQIQLYDRALQSATKLVVKHPKSKWVDDAILLMGRSLMGKGDFEGSRLKFVELRANFPRSELVDDSFLYQGETFRRERRWPEAVVYYDSLLSRFPQSDLAHEVQLRKAQIHLGRREYRPAIALLRPVAARGGDLELEARQELADAYFAIDRYDSARVEFHWLADETKSEELAQTAAMREAECWEQMRQFPQAIEVYQRIEKRSRRPDYRDAARIRRGYAVARGGNVAKGIEILEDVVEERQRSNSAAEALFRIGFIQESLLDDPEAARQTYAKVPEENRGSPFAQQAQQRLDNLTRIASLRESLAADTTGVHDAAAAAFAVAEHYLFDADHPERAIAEYAVVESTYRETPFGPKAAFAAAWVLERRLERAQAADSAWRRVAAAYPETIYGQAASAFVRGKVDSLRAGERLEPTLVRYPLSKGVVGYQRPQTRPTTGATTTRPPAAQQPPPPAAGPDPTVDAIRDTLRERDVDPVTPAPRDTVFDP